MDDIKYTITAYVPGNICNLRCEYCYVSNCYDEDHIIKGKYLYDIETMIKAFEPKRLGGIASITVIGGGETLVDERIVPFVHGLLKQGHVVEVVTNLTLNNRIDELLDFPEEQLKRLIVKGSLHWNELKRLNKIDDYFNNMNKVLKKGASSYPFLVCGDTYMPHLEDIQKTCLEKIGALPHCTPALKYEEKDDIKEYGHVQTSPACTADFVNKINNLFDSKVFKLSVKWLEIDPRKVFCYAGKWSFGVDIGNGNMFKCHGCPIECNFFKKIDEKPELEALGKNCKISTCALQYNFISQGLIPDKDSNETFANILYREHLFNDEVMSLLDFKYYNKYRRYNRFLEFIVDGSTRSLFLKKAKASLKNKIRLEIYNYLKKCLKRKG